MKTRFYPWMILFAPLLLVGYITRVFILMLRTGWYKAEMDVTKIYIASSNTPNPVNTPGFKHYTTEQLQTMLKEALTREYYELAEAIKQELKTR